MTKPGEKEYRARLEQQRIRHQKEKIAKEEQKRREMVARPSPMVFSKPLQKRANLKWVEERLEMAMTKAKKKKKKSQETIEFIFGK